MPLSGPGPVPLPSSAPPLAAACPVAGLWTWSVLSAAVRPPPADGAADQMARLHLLLLSCLLVGGRDRRRSLLVLGGFCSSRSLLVTAGYDCRSLFVPGGHCWSLVVIQLVSDCRLLATAGYDCRSLLTAVQRAGCTETETKIFLF